MFKPMRSMAVVCLVSMMGIAHIAAAVEIDIKDRAHLENTKLAAGSDAVPIATTRPQGAEGAVTYQWELDGVGSLGSRTDSGTFYTPPASIDGETQVTISVRVTDANGSTDDAQVTVTIVGGGNGESENTELSCPENFGEIDTNKIAEWRKQGEKDIPQRGVIAALLGIGSQKGQKKREVTLVWIENGQQRLACWSVFPEGTTEEEYLSEVRNAVPEFPKVDFKMLKRLNELWKQDKHIVLLP